MKYTTQCIDQEPFPSFGALALCFLIVCAECKHK
jgi:hypothetical protein